MSGPRPERTSTWLPGRHIVIGETTLSEGDDDIERASSCVPEEWCPREIPPEKPKKRKPYDPPGDLPGGITYLR